MLHSYDSLKQAAVPYLRSCFPRRSWEDEWLKKITVLECKIRLIEVCMQQPARRNTSALALGFLVTLTSKHIEDFETTPESKQITDSMSLWEVFQ